MVPFYLITGFLGSGKTTLLKEVLTSQGSSRKIVVIQNEFAHNGVDGQILKQASSNFELIEINNGSVFCVCLLGNFVKSLLEILEKFQPDAIFLEASGLADPINLAELLQDDKLQGRITLQHVYTVVDALNFEKGFQMMVRFKHQIMIADTVIINKSDLNIRGVPEITQKVKQLSPFATCVTANYCKEVFEGFNTRETSFKKASENFLGKQSGPRPQEVQTCVMRTTRSISRDSLQQFLKNIQPKCIRLKGFVALNSGEMLAIQTAFNQAEEKEIFNYSGPSELIAFSAKLSSPEFRKMYFSYTQKTHS